jgi:hypothetical protein
MIDIDVLKRAKEEIIERFMKKNPNIFAVGIGKKIVNGEETDDICIRVYVKVKLPENILRAEAILPKEIEILGHKIKIDVIEGEMPRALDVYTQKVRPLQGGYSVGHIDVTAGTIGAFVSAADGKECILSNNHVLANVNAAKIGDNILQPGSYDGGVNPTDCVATLKSFVPIKTIPYRDFQYGRYTDADWNETDCALGQILADADFALKCPDYNYPHTICEPTVDMLVKKDGRTTGFTHGKIADISYDTAVAYGSGSRPPIGLLKDQIMVSSSGAFSQGGDSGSGVIKEDGSAMVGLLFAGNTDGTQTICNKISVVLKSLDASLL